MFCWSWCLSTWLDLFILTFRWLSFTQQKQIASSGSANGVLAQAAACPRGSVGGCYVSCFLKWRVEIFPSLGFISQPSLLFQTQVAVALFTTEIWWWDGMEFEARSLSAILIVGAEAGGGFLEAVMTWQPNQSWVSVSQRLLKSSGWTSVISAQPSLMDRLIVCYQFTENWYIYILPATQGRHFQHTAGAPSKPFALWHADPGWPCSERGFLTLFLFPSRN